MDHRPLSAIVLAAGEGTRMRSSYPKPLHRLCGRPMVLYVVDALAELNVDRVVVVVGTGATELTKTIQAEAPQELSIEFVEQPERHGTGDAVAIALTGLFGSYGPEDFDEGDVIVRTGGHPAAAARHAGDARGGSSGKCRRGHAAHGQHGAS